MDDLISRQAVLDKLRKAEDHAFNTYYKGLVKAHKIIADMPSAEKTGRWIRVDDDKLKCNKCEVIHFIAQYPSAGQINYCPNCGSYNGG